MSADQWFPYLVRVRFVDHPYPSGTIVAAFISGTDAHAYCAAHKAQGGLVYSVEQVAA